MYVSIQVIGNAISGGKGWNAMKGKAAEFRAGPNYYNNLFNAWKPDQSVCPGSGGLLLSTMIYQIFNELGSNQGSLMLWFDAEARLLSAQLDTFNPTSKATTSTGIVTGPTPAAIGAEIERITPTETYFNLGVGANHCVVALASGVYKSCKITSLKSGKVMEIAQGSTQDGARLQQWTFNGAENQLWRLVPVSPDSYIIVSARSSKALDVPGHSTSNDTQIEQWAYNGGANQHWRVVELGNNDYKIESVESGKVLDVVGASTSDGAPIVQYVYGQAINQRWRLDGL